MNSVRRMFLLFLIAGVAMPRIVCSQTNAHSLLRKNIQNVIDSSGGKVGVGIMGLDFEDSLFIHDTDRFPMQSVYKFPLALAILHKVDKGQLSLEQKIHISKGSLDTKTWSPLLKDFPGQDIDLTLADLLAYTVSKSDNNGCDVLFRLVGGTQVVNTYIHGLGVRGIAIAATEAEMKKGWKVQYTNWCQPAAMIQLLQILYRGTALSKTSNDFLMKLMLECSTAPNRIKGLLPTNAVVAHKTGTSDTNEKGITAATNDVGIITLPDGRHFAIVVYVSDYTGDIEHAEHTIAEITKLAWDYFMAR